MKAKFSPDDEALEKLDTGVIEALVSNHAEFKRFLTKRLPSESVAEEILQQSLAKAVEKQSSLKNEESAVSWFYTVLKNALIDYYRSSASESDKNAAYLDELTILGGDRVAPADELEAAICACINRLLPTLKPAYAEIIKRVDLDGESLDQAAKDLGTNANNLAVRLHRARQALKTSLERSCGTCTEHGCLNCTCE